MMPEQEQPNVDVWIHTGEYAGDRSVMRRESDGAILNYEPGLFLIGAVAKLTTSPAEAKPGDELRIVAIEGYSRKELGLPEIEGVAHEKRIVMYR